MKASTVKLEQREEDYYLIITSEDKWIRPYERDKIKILIGNKETALKLLRSIQKYFNTDSGIISNENLEKIRLDLFRQKCPDDARVRAVNLFVATRKTEFTWFEGWKALYGDYLIREETRWGWKTAKEIKKLFLEEGISFDENGNYIK